jgi:predicted Zn-dependent peptidase
MALDHERHVLPGGTTVLARPLDVNDIVVVRAFSHMGVLYESDEESGISNLVQSVLPRGTANRTAHEIQEELAEMGADLDASSSFDLGSVSLRATRASWEAALDLWLEVLTEAVFPPEEIETEVEQALGAIDAREDQLSSRVMDLYRQLFYGEHPYHKPVLGTRETLRSFDREQVTAAARRFYRPVPPLVVAVGRFDPERLLGRLEAAFGRTPLVPPAPRPDPPEPGSGSRVLELGREAAYLVHGYPSPSYRDPDYPVARLVDALLGGSMSSRLFIELREKRALAYQVSTVFSDQLDGSFLAGYIVTDPARTQEAAERLEHEFQRIVEEPVSPAEIALARRYLRGSYLIAVETNVGQAARLARCEAYQLGQDFGDRWLTAIESVTPEIVQAFGRRWFTRAPARAMVLPRNGSRPALEGSLG